MLTTGQMLNRYQIIALLGEGGMGAVYQAHDPRLQRDVAIKVMHPHFARQPSFRERFNQEARTAARLDHPGIVKIFDSGEENEVLYIVMEYIHGPNLRQILTNLSKEKRLVILSEAAQVVRQICLALDYAHRNGVLHRDIKPDNIMLKPEPADNLPYRVVLTDLGLAKLLEGIPITQEGESLGTPAYMSPEQALGQPVDARSDVYSLGILLYELSVGRLPFPAKTLSEAIRYHTRELPPPPAGLRADLPDSLAKVILKCLEKDPGKRFSNAKDLAQAIEASLAAMLKTPTTPARSQSESTSGATSLMTQYQGSLMEMPEDKTGKIIPGHTPGLTSDTITVMVKDRTARSIPIKDKTITIGRSEDNHIFLDDPKASRRHVRVDFDGTDYQVIDMNTTNGTILGNTALLAGVPVAWNPEKLLRIGDTWLRLDRVSSPPAKPVQESAPSTFTQSLGGRVGIVLEPVTLSVQPGGSAVLKITVINQSPVVDHFAVSFSGVPADWLSGTPPEAQLMPGKRYEASLTIQPPSSPKSRAGDYALVARASSRTAPEDAAETRSTLTVTPFYRIDAGLHPQKQRSLDVGSYTIAVYNQGNADLHVLLSGSDAEEGCLYNFDPNKLIIPAGEERNAQLKVRPKATLSEWSTRTYYFILTVRAEEGAGLTQQIHGELEQAAPSLDISLRPQKQRGAIQGSFSVQLANHSPAPLNVRLEASDPEEGCRYLLNPSEMVIQPGQESASRLTIYPKSLIYGDQVKNFVFTVAGRLADTPGLLRQVQGEWQQAAPGVEASLLPPKQSGTSEGKFNIQLSNRSDAELVLDLKAFDPDNLCNYVLNPARLNIPVGETRFVDLKVISNIPLVDRASRQVLFDVTIRMVGETMPVARLQGEWEQWLPPTPAPAPVQQIAPALPEKPAVSPQPAPSPVQPVVVLPTPAPGMVQPAVALPTPAPAPIAKPKRSFWSGCLLFIVGMVLTVIGGFIAGVQINPSVYTNRSQADLFASAVLLVGLVLTLVIALRGYQKKAVGKLILIAIFGFIAICVISILRANLGLR